MLYGLCGFFVSLVMTNSSWTQAHIRSLWRLGGQRIWTVFPPCDTSALQVSPRDYKGELTRSLYAVRLAMASVAGRPRPYAVVSGSSKTGRLTKLAPRYDIAFQDLPLRPREPVILSVGQFRPEKDHPLQIRAFARFVKPAGIDGGRGEKGRIKERVKLVLLGSCRGSEDERRVQSLRSLAADMGVGDRVQFVVGAHFSELKEWLGRASVGLHTMWNEHFGICVVEYMVNNNGFVVRGTLRVTGEREGFREERAKQHLARAPKIS